MTLFLADRPPETKQERSGTIPVLSVPKRGSQSDRMQDVKRRVCTARRKSLPRLRYRGRRRCSASQSAVSSLKEGFKVRFRIDFSVASSELVSNSPITVTISGEAVEDLTGGTVEVTLPTQGETGHAGSGKRPSYPQGQKFPVVVRWQLPAMSAGDTWSRSVSIGSVDSGYYQIAATATTTAPAGKPVALISNDVSREMWMLVNTDGGSVTGVFNEDVIPPGFAKVPGPFRAEGTSPVKTPGQTAAYGGGGSVAYSMNSYLWLNVVYMHDNTQHPAKGAIVQSNTIDGNGDEQEMRWSRFFGQVVKVDSRTEEEAPRWPGRDGGSRRSSRRG